MYYLLKKKDKKEGAEMKKRCRKCRYYHKADAEHGSDGCYYWCEGSRSGFDCYKTERFLEWFPLIISAVALLLVLLRPTLVDMLR